MYNNGFGYGNDFGSSSFVNSSMGSTVWTIVALILSFVGCFVIYFLFVEKKNNPKEKFLSWMKDFLSFDKMLIETILKIAYIFVALFITLGSFSLIGNSFLSFLLTLIFGNIIARVIFEAIMLNVMIWKNTSEIKKKLK